MRLLKLPSLNELKEAGIYYDGINLYTPSGVVSALDPMSGLKVKVNKVFYRASRIAWLLFYQEPPRDRVRFIDGDPSNLSHDNLMDGYTQKELRKLVKSNRVLPRWVNRESKGRGFQVSFYVGGKTIYIGHSGDLNKAHYLAYEVEKAIYPTMTTIEPPNYVPSQDDRDALAEKIKKIKEKLDVK